MFSALAWRLSRKKSGVSHWLQQQAASYLDYYNDFSYDFATNGERRLLEMLSPFGAKVVFDVGAHVGDWSRLAGAAFPDATIHAFEISASTREVLRTNLRTRRYVIADLALGDANGVIRYKDYGDLSLVNTMVSTSFHDSRMAFTMRDAKLARGDEYLASLGIDHIDFLKVDVEGAELLVLRGFEHALAEHRIDVIQFEYGHANGDAGHLMKDFYALLEGRDYAVGRLWSVGVQFSPFEYRLNNFDSGPNFVAVLRSRPEIIRALASRPSG